MLANAELLIIEEKLAVMSRPTGVHAYDFDFSLYFQCRHPYRIESEMLAILRIGAPENYTSTFDDTAAIGLRLINDPEQHKLASEIESWYPHLADSTPRTQIFDALPDAEFVESEFGWPVFLKGSRQTSKHNPDLAVIRDRGHYLRACAAYLRDPILHWQKPVLREFITLAPAQGFVPGKISASLEFRTFWLDGGHVGHGPYWYQIAPYRCADIDDGLALAETVAGRIPVPFLVVDIAKTIDGRWVVIECNDAQESGHAGISAQQLWRRVIDSA